MYQGKFDSQKKESQRSVYELLQEREARKASRAPQKAAAPGRPAPARDGQPVGKPAQPGRAPQNPAGRSSQNPAGRTPTRAVPPSKPAALPETPAPKKRHGTLVFYTVCMGFVFVFYLATFLGLRYLNAWLVRFEAAQPTTKSAEAFQQLFANPDWAALYDRAGMTIGKDSFCQVMAEKVAGQALDYAETSAGLAKDQKKYVVLLGDETIGTFTLANRNPATEETELPDWQLDSVEFMLETKAPFRVRLREGHTAMVNGQPLTDERVVIRETSRAKDYLPITVAAPAYRTLELAGLLEQPEVSVVDENGKALLVDYDPSDRTFREVESVPELPRDLEELALKAVKTYASFMSTKTGFNNELAKYFDKNSETYKSIVKTERNWTQEGSNYYFTDESVTDYQVYAQDIFSVRVHVTLNVDRKDENTTKQTPIRQTLFFSEVSAGKWTCFHMTAVDAAQLEKQVLLTFRDGDTVLSSEFVDANTVNLTCPLITAPEGKTFAGWMVEEQDATGATVLKLVFEPNESGQVTVAGGLEPMTLYPLFE